jgi:diguanylate cyclase (GGDEF)-like protein
MWKSIIDEGYWQGEIWNRKKDGSLYLQWMRVFSIRNENNEINEYVSVCTDISERHLLLEELNQSVYYDALTGLPNPVLLRQEFQDSVELLARKNKKQYFVAINIDQFSYINLLYGYRIGDQLLIDIANRIKHKLRSKDSIYRFSGDVYILLIRDIEEVEIVINIVDRVFDMIRQPFMIEGKEISITASFGISLYPDDGMSYENLLQNAETALREAKQSGKNAVKFFSEKMNEKATHWFILGNQLNSAIFNNELCMYYQIQVDNKSKEIIGVESLVRWNHKEYGVLSPDEFIPFAETSGLILPLGYWVINNVFKQVRNHVDKGYRLIKYSINLSAKQLEDKDFITKVNDLLEFYKLNSENIVFEITESSAMLNPEVSNKVLNQLKEMGFHLAMDDFGTGYSSLSSLNQFPIDILKIDRSFITHISKDMKKQRLTLAILAMTEIVGLSTVAEGVETLEDVEFLAHQKCDILQGYYFSKPINEIEFNRILENL